MAILPSVNRPSSSTPLANFFVVQQQVNELRDLDVIDGDFRLAKLGDHQVVLFGVFTER